MISKYREIYLDNLTKTVNKILERYNEGEKLTEENFTLLLYYMKELKQLEQTPLITKFLNAFNQIRNTLNESLTNSIENKEEL